MTREVPLTIHDDDDDDMPPLLLSRLVYVRGESFVREYFYGDDDALVSVEHRPFNFFPAGTSIEVVDVPPFSLN